MPTCPYCTGGQIDDGYAACYSCGGSGRCMDSACMACSGSGRGSRQYRSCSSCGGRGYTPDPPPSASQQGQRGARSGRGQPSPIPPAGAAPVAQSPNKWGVANYLFFGLTYLAVLGYLDGETDMEGWALFLLPLIPAWMVGAWWKFLFVMTLLFGGLYIWGASQGPS